ncbi:MAG: hypothetical protein Q4G35_07410 [Propionibacteriaceae bacterium]|nr:hypothetical protein [Propionibacteriaceae bacterium]
MTKKYELNYDWHLLGPTVWTEESTVTLQVDLHSYEHGPALWGAIGNWWEGLESSTEDGERVAYEGGANFPKPVRVSDRHVTAWIVSSGQDAFDTIAHYANVMRDVAVEADAEVAAVWTELPHRG